MRLKSWRRSHQCLDEWLSCLITDQLATRICQMRWCPILFEQCKNCFCRWVLCHEKSWHVGKCRCMHHLLHVFEHFLRCQHIHSMSNTEIGRLICNGIGLEQLWMQEMDCCGLFCIVGWWTLQDFSPRPWHLGFWCRRWSSYSSSSGGWSFCCWLYKDFHITRLLCCTWCRSGQGMSA